MKASDAASSLQDGIMRELLFDESEPDEEIWVVFHWSEFPDGHKEPGELRYLRFVTEEDARRAMRDMEKFHNLTREKLLDLAGCFEHTEEDLDHIDKKGPNYQSPPADPKATDEADVYQARLKVMAELQPKTVALLKLADETKDPVQRQKVEQEAV